MYKDAPFERRPLEEIFRDIETAQRINGPRVRTVFIGDSNSLILDSKTLAKVLEYLYQHFPSIERVTSYARARTLCKKSKDELREIRQAGLTRLHVGLETGDPELLKEIKKGATPEQMVEGCVRAKDAGFEVSLYVLAGIGGEEKWRNHAEGTAALFQMASPETILREQRRLIELLEVSSQYLSDHISNYVPVHGQLPGEKSLMLQTLDDALAVLQENDGYRQALEQKRYLTRL
jgi:biotin synthase-like enzyme